MFYVDEFVYANKLRYDHPLEKTIFAIATMFLGLLSNKPFVNLSIIMIMVALLYLKAAIPGFVLRKLMLIPVSFLFLGVIPILLTFSLNQTEMIMYLKIGSYYLGFTQNGILVAVNTVLRAAGSIACLYFLALTTPMIELIYVLNLFRMPGLIIELMILIYRFIFVFIETAFNIYTAQSSRWGYHNFKQSINSLGILFANLWRKTYLKSQTLFISLISRGYEDEIRVLNPAYTFTKNIYLYLIVDVVLIFLAFI
ncbi:MAG: cobalt ECF transporter T component CbiQ [Peptococcaceae bacterium]